MDPHGRWWLRKTWTVTMSLLSLAPRNNILPWWGSECKHVLRPLHFHSTLNSRAHQNKNIGVLFPVVRPLNEFLGPVDDFHGHGSWSVCKATLMFVPHVEC